MISRWRAVLIFGPPGSGKGTQAKNLLNLAPFVHVSTGDIFRSIPKSSNAAKQLAKYTSQGQLVPDEVTLEIWQQYVQGLEQTFRFDPSTHILLLDGIPRTKKQAQMLESLVKVKLIINLQIQDEKVLMERLAQRAQIEGRADDAKADVIQNRLRVYHAQTHETLSHYPESLVANINGNQSPLMVLHDILPVVQKAVTEI